MTFNLFRNSSFKKITSIVTLVVVFIGISSALAYADSKEVWSFTASAQKESESKIEKNEKQEIHKKDKEEKSDKKNQEETGGELLSGARLITPGIHHVLSTGQSLSIGVVGGSKLTTTQPYTNKMLNATNTAFIPLVESATGASSTSVETMSSALGNMITSLANPDPYQMLVSLHGKNGYSYAQLKKGTAPYAQGIAQVNAAKSLANTAGIPYMVSAVTTVHGETDELQNMTDTTYEAKLVEWQNDYQADVNAITGQTGILPMFTDQMASWAGNNIKHATPKVALGQWNAAKNNPDKIFLVTPKYMLDYQDYLHLKNYSYRRLGEYYGKVMKKVLVDEEPWLPLSPIRITRVDNKIYAKFHVPVAPIAFDTTAVDPMAHYGFEYVDATGSASLTGTSGIQIIDGDTLEITLSTTPTGSNQRLRYAYTGTVVSYPGAHRVGSPKGNIRDSDATPALYTAGVPTAMGNYLRNWLITFDEPVVPAVAPDAPTNVTAVAWDGDANVNFTPPADNGGAPILTYVVTSSPDNIIVSSPDYPVHVTGLTNETVYTFTVQAVNAVGTSVASAPSDAVNPHDLTSPIISSVSSDPDGDSAVISWETNELASSEVEYGSDTSYGMSTGELDFSPRVIEHSVQLSDLVPATTYHFRVISKDSNGNTATSADYTFSTNEFNRQIGYESGGGIRMSPEPGESVGKE